METSEVSAWAESNLPELILLIGGILALAIAISYARSKDSGKYKFLMVLGLIFGVIMAVEAAMSYGEWRMVTSIIVAVAAFALIIRPFREVNVAIILSLFVMVIIYLSMGALNGVMLFDHIDLTMLSEGWPRIIAAFLIGAVVYMIANFAESLVKLFGKFLNFWPVLLVLGLFCITESIFMFAGYGSITDYIDIQTPAAILF